MVLSTGGVVVGVAHAINAQADPFTVKANGGLNVRSGPGLGNRIIGNLPTGARIDSTGAARNGWMPIRFGSGTGWVSDLYLQAQGAGQQPSGTVPTSGRGQAYTTAALNVRSGAGISFRVITVLGKGDRVETTGVNASGYSQIVHAGQLRWVSSQYLSAQPGATPAPSSNGLPAIVGTARATADLMIRTTSGDRFENIRDVPAGTVLQLTGVTENGRTQIVFEGAVRWVNSLYLSGNASVPKPSGGSGNSSAPVSTVGVIGANGLTANSRNLLGRLQQQFPEVRTYMGVRQDSLPDHPSGRALDAMVYTNSALGDRIAEYVKDHAGELNVDYVIWNQHIWSVARSREGWRYMADRGSTTANHKDHVHVTVR